MDQETLQRMMADFLRIAQHNLSSDGRLAQVGVIITGSKVPFEAKFMPFEFGNDDEKAKVAQAFTTMARTLKATAVITVHDAFIAMMDKDEELPDGKRVHDLPQARDCIVVAGRTADINLLTGAYYVKTDKGFQFEPIEIPEGAGAITSRFSDGIWDEHTTH